MYSHVLLYAREGIWCRKIIYLNTCRGKVCREPWPIMLYSCGLTHFIINPWFVCVQLLALWQQFPVRGCGRGDRDISSPVLSYIPHVQEKQTNCKFFCQEEVPFKSCYIASHSCVVIEILALLYPVLLGLALRFVHKAKFVNLKSWDLRSSYKVNFRHILLKGFWWEKLRMACGMRLR